MARRTPTSGRIGTKAAQATDEASAEAAPASQGQGLTFNDALVLTTTVLLLAAFLMADYVQGTRFGEGLFFK